MDLQVDFDFSKDTYRHSMNGVLSVLHCHHYLCLTTQMAIQHSNIGGIEILKKTTEDTIYPLIMDYVTGNHITDPKSRLQVGEAYYAVMGLGKMEAMLRGKDGVVHLLRSHIDQGWLSKWGRTNGCVNYFTCGYIAAMFAVAGDSLPGSFAVKEMESIVSGKEISRFTVARKMA